MVQIHAPTFFLSELKMFPVFPEVAGIDGNSLEYTARRMVAQYDGGVQSFANDVGKVNAIGATFRFSRVLTALQAEDVAEFLDARAGWQPFEFNFDGAAGNAIVVTCSGYEAKAIGFDLWELSADFVQFL